MRDGPSIFLVGFMGSGKSAVGHALAQRIRWTFVDSDERVEARAGCAIAALFARDGEAAFRMLEREVLAELATRRGHVVATGGGAFLDATTRRRLNRDGATVWLDVPLDVARARVGQGRGRPLWSTDDPIALRALYERRRAVYALARHKVDAVGALESTVEAVLSEISSICR